LATEVQNTLSAWRRATRLDAGLVYVYGPGVALPTLESKLASVGLQALTPAAPPGSPDLDIADCATSYVAVLAALADPADFVGFPDRRGDARRAALQHAAQRTKQVTIAAVVAAVAILGIAVPIGRGAIDRGLATRRLHAAQSTIQRLAPYESTYNRVRDAEQAWSANAGAEPDWSRTLAAISASAPAGVNIATLRVDDTSSPGVVTVDVEATGSPAAFADLQSWAHALATNPAVSAVFAPSATTDAGPGRAATKSTFELKFALAARAVTTSRPFPGGPLP
jgi:hypothetical protein